MKVQGGAVGLVIDARGRPIAMPTSHSSRVAKLRAWYAAMNLPTA
jgi:hypothetical protein